MEQIWNKYGTNMEQIWDKYGSNFCRISYIQTNMDKYGQTWTNMEVIFAEYRIQTTSQY